MAEQVKARLLKPGQYFFTTPDHQVYRVVRVQISGPPPQNKPKTLEQVEESLRKYPNMRKDIVRKTKVRVYVDGKTYPLLLDYGDSVHLY